MRSEANPWRPAAFPADNSDQDRSRTSTAARSGDIRFLPDEELHRQISAGWEEWSDLQEALLATGGMLPSRELAVRAAVFFEDPYWTFEEARVEALRRQSVAAGLRSLRSVDAGLELL